MTSATVIKVRALLVDALSDLNYKRRQGAITRTEWIAELRHLEFIGAPVGWTLRAEGPITDVILSELHAMSKGA